MPQSSYSSSPRCFEDFLSFFRFFVAMASLPSAPEGWESPNRPSGTSGSRCFFFDLAAGAPSTGTSTATRSTCPVSALFRLRSSFFLRRSSFARLFSLFFWLSSQSETSFSTLAVTAFSSRALVVGWRGTNIAANIDDDEVPIPPRTGSSSKPPSGGGIRDGRPPKPKPARPWSPPSSRVEAEAAAQVG